ADRLGRAMTAASRAAIGLMADRSRRGRSGNPVDNPPNAVRSQGSGVRVPGECVVDPSQSVLWEGEAPAEPQRRTSTRPASGSTLRGYSFLSSTGFQPVRVEYRVGCTG